MPLSVPLIELRRNLRAEAGQTLNPAQMVQAQDAQDLQLNRQQRELWDRYEWPHLQYHLDLTVEAGASLSEFPPTMPYEQINRVYWAANGESRWKPLDYGIRAYDTPPGPPVLGTPCRWDNMAIVTPDGASDGVGLMQILPVPQTDGILRLEGQVPLTPMVNDNDVCIIDSTLIVLFCAAEILATNKAEVAQLKLQKANEVLRSLRINGGAAKRRNYSMGGSYGSTRSRYGSGGVPYIDYIPS